MPGRFEGKVVVVTGAARGQGRSHAVRFAEEGADVIAVDVCAQVATAPYPLAAADDLAQTVKEVRATGRRVVAAEADTRDFPALKAAIDRGAEELGRLDVVVANAAIVSFGSLLDLPEETWRDVVDINLTGAWHTVKAAVPHLVAGGRGGAVVLTSSAAGLRAYPGLGHYVAAKHGLVGLMKTLAIELGPHSIRVNSVHPTQVDTPMLQNDAVYSAFLPGTENPGKNDFAPVSQSMHALPVPWVEAQDVSGAVLYLASAEARYVTGAALPVDAGTLLV
ncbi:mycofactocin-coupled SDR family oxidoreductase [Amycolatopsis sp. VS8301801F10]|uniref:mycofactocin-coupled SDR family oxidoreductase n=1 Tax=Amycolatopsis sp. VS8301801F10 TaxID=2652442 RepID=UPI0038FC8869